MIDYLQLAGKTVLVFGVANRKSVAFHVARLLHESGANVIYSVRSAARRDALTRLLAQSRPDAEIHVCDVEHADQIAELRRSVSRRHEAIHGIVHSIAWAGYEEPARDADRASRGAVDGASPAFKAFHETTKREFLRSLDISCYSLIAIAREFKALLDRDASVVTISISTTRMASENYGYMAPIKAALDSTVVFLAKSFSRESRVRFNAVCPGLLKTSASAGIPGYVDSYLYAEQATLRKKAVLTEEVANVVAFLLSPRSSGINAERLVVDAGMGVNYFDRELIERVLR